MTSSTLELQRDRPDDFAVGPEEYGRGFYS